MSYVAVEQKLCPVCRTTHDTGVLIDKRLREDTFKERHVTTGMQLCPAHRKVADDDDYVYLCEADPTQTSRTEVYFCAGIMAIKRDVIPMILEVDDKLAAWMRDERYVMIEPAVFAALSEVQGAQVVEEGDPVLFPKPLHDA